MLDLITVGAAMGLQEELRNLRKQRGQETFVHEDDESSNGEQSAVEVLAENTSHAIDTIENAVSSAVAAVTEQMPDPSAILPITSYQPLTVDLTLPTVNSVSKKE